MSEEIKFSPLGDRILLQVIKAEETITSSGLFIPDSVKEKPQQGIIVAAGNGKLREDGHLIPMDVKVGDLVLYGKYSGTEIKLEGKEYLIMHQDDVLGIIRK